MGYSQGINLFPKPLEPEEEAKYIEQFYNGKGSERENARNILIEHNLRLVAHIAKKYASSTMLPDDLISVGTIGLIKAISTFKPDKGNRLGTYAVRCIENEMLMYMRSSKKFGSEVSINEPVGTDKEGNEIAIMDLLCDDGTEMLDSIDTRLQQARLHTVMSAVLSPREIEILSLRYGIGKPESAGTELTQREVGKILGCSRSYISRLEKRAIEKLRSVMTDDI